MTNIELIQEWYKNHCNSDWEHEYGVKIETLDNPGWIASIDLVDTFLQGFEYQYSKKGEDDWLELVSDGEVFRGAGDFLKLDEILDKFINEFALPNIKNAKMIYEIYEKIPEYSPLLIPCNIATPIAPPTACFRPKAASMMLINNPGI